MIERPSFAIFFKKGLNLFRFNTKRVKTKQMITKLKRHQATKAIHKPKDKMKIRSR